MAIELADAQIDWNSVKSDQVSAENVIPALTFDPEAVYPVKELEKVKELEDDFGRQQILASPLPGLQLPVLSA
jgi:hypothetical protein